ncbi:homeobox-containing protein 1a isoform X2 [Astyanax mexicanus]|uniref:homeobox-containing protein 1a isoform X2 n=1 Tax=Astyanax mexicanus TaxID=7994 RepID=UPI0020CB125C|nr:homeobox-containing protein 1a isoform X2 [Astyanax mexicanus]
MSHFPEEPRFTIEQIDLLQRLRRSGMAKREILHALDTLERLEREHVQKFGHRHSYGGGEGGTEAGGASVQTGNSHGGSTSTSGGASSHAASSSKASVSTQTLFHRNALSPLSNNYETSPPPTVTMPMPMMAPPAQNGRDSMVPLSNGTLSPNQYPVSAAPVRAFGFEPTEEEVDIDDKVEELMRKDSNIVKEEIKAFLGTRRISQAVVAQVTGISQSRISHWLLQQGSDLSEQKKRAFYRWYQLEKTTPGATLAMRPAPMAIEDIVEWHQTGPPISCSPGSFRLRRGSRFTWRKECLAVMESYFNDNQYPDEAKREEIANACNAVIQKPGKKLSDLERVTSLKVYNWFANRRKEIKRRANIAAILESHGLDVQSPGGQSNSDEIDGTEYSEPAAEQSLGPRAVARGFAFSRGDLPSPVQVLTSGSDTNNMKTRELSMGEKQAIVKLREDGKSIRAIAQTLAIANTTVWNILKKKVVTGVLSNRCRTGRPRKTTALDDRNIVSAVENDPKTTVSDISNTLQRAGVKVSQSTVRRRLHEQKYRSFTERCESLISHEVQRQAAEILGQSFFD